MTKGYNGKTYSSPSRASQARLSQKSGSHNTFGGYTKVNNRDGSFFMKKTGK